MELLDVFADVRDDDRDAVAVLHLARESHEQLSAPFVGGRDADPRWVRAGSDGLDGRDQSRTYRRELPLLGRRVRAGENFARFLGVV